MNKDSQQDLNYYWNSEEAVLYFKNKVPDPRLVRRLHEFVISHHGEQLHAVDIGCGGGRHTKLLHDLNFITDACDVSSRMLETTRKILPDIAFKIIKASILNLPYKNESFDVVIATGVMHQVTSVQEYIRAIGEISRILKPKGLFLMNVFTSKTIDQNLNLQKGQNSVYKTREGLFMTLLDGTQLTTLLHNHGLELEGTPEESDKPEPTGIRSVFRATFIKVPS